MAAASSSSSCITNFARLGHASQDTLPKLWQTILAIYEKQQNILLDCKKNPYLMSDWGLTPVELNKIRKAATDGYGNFDIALLYKLFRNLTFDKPTRPLPPYARPTKGYGHPNGPGSTDFTIGDELERCRNKRNNILHRGNASITEQEMKADFTLFKEIAARLEPLFNFTSGRFVAEFEKLETRCMDEEKEAEYVKHLKILIEREQEVFQRLSSIEGEIKELKSPDKETLQFITPLEDKTCFEGETVSLECTVAGGKKPFKWYRDDLAVLSDKLRDESKDQTYKLTIIDATREDAGIYQIKIGNSVLEARLTVLETLIH